MSRRKWPLISEEEASRDPYPWIFSDSDENLRELTDEEKAYLESPEPTGDEHTWPLIRGRFCGLAPDGGRRGFVHRSSVPHSYRSRSGIA